MLRLQVQYMRARSSQISPQRYCQSLFSVQFGHSVKTMERVGARRVGAVLSGVGRVMKMRKGGA